jgi:hypothetical protein
MVEPNGPMQKHRLAKIDGILHRPIRIKTRLNVAKERLMLRQAMLEFGQ